MSLNIANENMDRLLALMNRHNDSDDSENEEIDYSEIKPDIEKWYKKDSKTWYELSSRKMLVHPSTYCDLNEHGLKELERVREMVRTTEPTGILVDTLYNPVGSGPWEADTNSRWYNKGDSIMHLCSIENMQLQAPLNVQENEEKQYIMTSLVRWMGVHHLELTADSSAPSDSNPNIHRVIRWAVTASGSIYHYSLVDYLAKIADEKLKDQLTMTIVLQKTGLDEDAAHIMSNMIEHVLETPVYI